MTLRSDRPHGIRAYRRHLDQREVRRLQGDAHEGGGGELYADEEQPRGGHRRRGRAEEGHEDAEQSRGLAAEE
eukprot:9720507-Heterocapsa_arctica.AAC.1